MFGGSGLASAFESKTLTAKNAFWPIIQKLLVPTISLASPFVLFDDDKSFLFATWDNFVSVVKPDLIALQ